MYSIVLTLHHNTTQYNTIHPGFGLLFYCCFITAYQKGESMGESEDVLM